MTDKTVPWPETIWNKSYGEPGCMADAASKAYEEIRGIHGDHGFYESINIIYRAMRAAAHEAEE